MTPEKIQAALTTLVAEGIVVDETRFATASSERWVDQTAYKQWAFSLAACLESAFGSEHHLTAEAKRISRELNYLGNYQGLLGIAKAAEASWRNGYIFDVRKLVRADVESDLIGQAGQLLSGGYDRAAAVVAGAVLEGHLRDIAASWGVAVVDGKGKHLTLGPLSIELKKAGAFDGIMQSRIDHLAKLRNDAAHGGLFDGRATDVERMIRDVTDICDRVKSP